MSAAASRLRVPDEIRELIRGLSPDTKRKVRAALDALVEDPDTGMALSEQLAGYRRIRIGGWRIVYRLEAKVIQIHAIGRRSTVYAELLSRIDRRSPRSLKGHMRELQEDLGLVAIATQREKTYRPRRALRRLPR